jgi:hypothetical protein
MNLQSEIDHVCILRCLPQLQSVLQTSFVCERLKAIAHCNSYSFRAIAFLPITNNCSNTVNILSSKEQKS